MKEALLILVHGSPRPVANEDMFRVVEQLRARPDVRRRFPIVVVGFMECNQPSIPDAIAQCIAQGAECVRAVPYFLHTGNHVCEDLPALMEEAQALYPDVEFLMGDYIGLAPSITGLLTKRAVAAAAGSPGQSDLISVA